MKRISTDFCSLLHSSFLKQLLLSPFAQPAHFFLSAVLFMQTDFIICSLYCCLLGAGKPSGDLQLAIDSGLLFEMFLSLLNVWWQRLTLRIPGTGPVVLPLGVRALSLHHL